MARGEIVGLVGESGCGKSTLARAAVGLEPLAAGAVTFEGRAVAALGRRRRPEFLRGLQMVFQDPYESLNPRRKVGEIIADGVRLGGGSREERPAAGRRAAGTRRASGHRGGQLPARVQRRPAAADRHRQDAGDAALLPDRRRADQRRWTPRPRRRSPTCSASWSTGRPRARPGLPRPVRGPPGRGPGRGHVPGPDRRDRRDRRGLGQPAAPLHRGADSRDTAGRGRCTADRPARRRARPGQSPGGLPVPPALPARPGQLPRTRPAAGPGGGP